MMTSKDVEVQAAINLLEDEFIISQEYKPVEDEMYDTITYLRRCLAIRIGHRVIKEYS